MFHILNCVLMQPLESMKTPQSSKANKIALDAISGRNYSGAALPSKVKAWSLLRSTIADHAQVRPFSSDQNVPDKKKEVRARVIKS